MLGRVFNTALGLIAEELLAERKPHKDLGSAKETPDDIDRVQSLEEAHEGP